MENNAHKRILVVNSGSSSIKFALYKADDSRQSVVSGKIDRIGLPDPTLSWREAASGIRTTQPVAIGEHLAAPQVLAETLGKYGDWKAIAAIGHRIVHGGPNFKQPTIVTPEMLAELRRICPYDPDHFPAQIELIEAFERLFPNVMQVACFDTAFHRQMPRVAKILPIPRRYDAKGIQRYGFHGLSYSFIMEELARTAGQAVAQGRLVLAHLGNGASLAAVQGGKGIDTSMAFTPTAGVPMSNRTGDLDPGVMFYLAQTEQMTPEEFQKMVNHESGLLGISETSSDMRDLLSREGQDVRAAEAVALFCYQVKKWVGSFAAALGGLDTLVFAGGIGENAAPVRARICQGLAFLGIELDPVRNAAHAPVISIQGSRATVRVIHTDEEAVIARAVWAMMGEKPNSKLQTPNSS